MKDTSGAVMPGVTVEAASPALIEKVRTVVTDAQGQYKIVDLRVDFRFTRIFQVGRAKVRGNFDIYNVLNASSILATNTAYGPLWLNARQILGGRLFKFSGQLEF